MARTRRRNRRVESDRRLGNVARATRDDALERQLAGSIAVTGIQLSATRPGNALVTRPRQHQRRGGIDLAHGKRALRPALLAHAGVGIGGARTRNERLRTRGFALGRTRRIGEHARVGLDDRVRATCLGLAPANVVTARIIEATRTRGVAVRRVGGRRLPVDGRAVTRLRRELERATCRQSYGEPDE